jgi:hypothetical protein
MRFLRPLVGPTRLDRQRNPNISNILKGGQHSRRHKTVSKEMVRPPGTNGQKPSTEAGFPVPMLVTAGYGNTETKMVRQRNRL